MRILWFKRRDYPIKGGRSVVRLAPKLSIAALKAKLDRELTLWYCLGARNHRGSGRLGLEDAIDIHVSLFGYSASMAYGTLTDDDGLYFGPKGQ